MEENPNSEMNDVSQEMNPQEEQSQNKSLSEQEVAYLIDIYKDKIAKYKSQDALE